MSGFELKRRRNAPVLVDVATLDEIEALLRAGFVDDSTAETCGDSPEADCHACRVVRVLKALGRWP